MLDATPLLYHVYAVASRSKWITSYGTREGESGGERGRVLENERENVVSERVAQRWSNISTMEKKTLKFYHVLEDLNYGILRIYAEFWKKIRKKKKYA